MQIENELEKSEIILSSKDVFKSNNNNFSLLFTNIEESKKLLKSFEIFINKYYESINYYFKQLTEFNSNFLEEKFKSSVINSPIFQLCKITKKAVQAQIDNLFSIISNQQIFFAFIESISNLSKILQESEIKFGKNTSNKNGPNAHIQPVFISLMETFAEIESKVIDEYVYKKYNKHVLGINDNPLKNNIEKAKFLEKTFLVFEEDIKNQLLNDFQDMEKKTNEIFNKMKSIVKNIVGFLRENNTTYLDELKNEIDLIGLKTRNSSINLNSSYLSIQNLEPEIEIKNEDNLDMFQYSMKIIHNPKINVIDSNKIKNENNNKEINEEQIEKNNIIIEFKNQENQEKKEIIRNDDGENEKINDKEVNKDNIEEIYNDSELILTEDDIYNIVSTLYKYDFKMLNRKEYDLNIEKEKIKVSNLTKKLLTFDGENNIKEIITDEEVNNLYNLLNDGPTILNVFIMLNNYRSTGRYEATERSFNIIKNIFNKAQDYLLNNRSILLEGLIIILCQTYYIMKDGQKVYIQKEIKNHPLFKKEEFWKNYLNETLDEDIEKMLKEEKNINLEISKERHQKKINDLILSKIVPFTSYMNDFELKDISIMNIISNIFDKYDVDDEGKYIIMSSLERKKY